MTVDAVFLDRDGTLIEYRPYLSDPTLVRLYPGVGASLRRLADAGLKLVVVTNQSGVGREYYSEQDVKAVNRRMDSLLAEYRVRLDRTYWCPHHPDDGCLCRKPGTGLAERATADLGIHLASSFVIGDSRSDMEFGRAIGATTVLVRTGRGLEEAGRAGDSVDRVAADMVGAAEIVLKLRATVSWEQSTSP